MEVSVVSRQEEYNLNSIELIQEEKQPDNYYLKKDINDQVEILNTLLPGIGGIDKEIIKQNLPPNAEGWFAIPRWEKLAPTYHEAIHLMFDLLAEQRNFDNYRQRDTDAKHLRQSQRSVMFTDKIKDMQKSDILIIPIQFGLYHRGSSYFAREAISCSNNEFGLGVFETGMILLTHPERLQDDDSLCVNCIGDEYSPYANGIFPSVPVFGYENNRLEFYTGWIRDSSLATTSVSGWAI